MKFALPLLLAVPGVTALTTMNQALMMRLTDLRNAEGSQVLSDVWRTVALGAIMGVKDFNERNSRYVSEMGSTAMGACDIQINPTMYDTGSNSKGSIMAYRAARADNFDGTDYSLHSIIGAARSDASKPMATLGAIDGVPQSSYWSTSDGLDDTGVYSYFSRTIPADSAVAKAAAELVKSQGHTKVGIAHVDDPYGSSWKDAFVKYCSEFDPSIQVVTSGFVGGNQASAENSAVVLNSQDIRVGFVVAFDATFGYFMDKAEELGMVGPGYFWITGDGVGSAKIQGSNAKQSNGIGKMLSLGGVPGATVYDQFKADWDLFDSSAAGTALKTYAEAMWLDPHTADASHAAAEGTDLSLIGSTFFADNAPDDVATYAYDAVMQHGIGACAYKAAGGAFDTAFDGSAFYAATAAVEFTSITGSVRFLDTTGSRDPASSNFILYNWQCEGAEGLETCTQYTAGSWTMAGGWDYSGGNTPDVDTDGTPDGFRFSDNTLTSPSDSPSEIEVLKIGFLHPFYTLDGTDYIYSSSGHNNMVGSLMALQEINARSDLLPNTELKFEVYDTNHDAGAITGGAIHFATTAFNGKGADVVVGGAYSGPTIASHNVLKGFGMPQMSYSATSPLLSNSKEYPYFFRPVPSDAFQGKAIAQFLKNDLEFNNVCILHGDDGYNANLAAAFAASSFDLDLNVVKTIQTTEKPEVKEAKEAIAMLANSECRVMFMSLHPSSAATVVREASIKGIMGPESGWLWVFPDAITVGVTDVIAGASISADYCSDGSPLAGCSAAMTLTTPAVDGAAAMTGAMGCIPLAPSGSALATFMTAYEGQTNTQGTCGNDSPVGVGGCTCGVGADDADNNLFQRDHDRDPSTPDRCVGFEYTSTEAGYFEPEGYTYYAYDVIYAFAHAAQRMLDEGATSFNKAAMTEALKAISFESVTGTVDFENTGDREIGAGFTIKNYKADTGFEAIGDWDMSTGVVFKAGAQAALTWPTSNNAKPVDVPSKIEELRMGFLHPFYTLDGTDYTYSSSGHNNLVGSLLALEEINGRDDLLPNTKLKFEVLDTHHDAGAITGHAISFATTAFNGKGADVVVGGAYSGATMASHNVLKGFGIPQMSYSATSPLLSDSKEFPYFFRPVPSDAFQGAAIAQFLKNDLEFTNVCVVNGKDSYNANLAAAFSQASLDLGIIVVKTVETNYKPEEKEAADAIAMLKDASCRVVFFSLHPGSAAPVMRQAAAAGIMGPESGWMWVYPDAITVGVADVLTAVVVEATFVNADGETIKTAGAPANLMEGSMGCIPLAPSGTALSTFMTAYEGMANTQGTCGNDASVTDSCSCAPGVDDAGMGLFQRDHDNDPSTPDRCVGFEYKSDQTGYFAPEGYTYYAYDVIYAFAYAAQSLLDADATEFDKAAMTQALKDISFQSVTGTVDFENNGDREIGAGFTIKNYKTSGFTAIGDWDKSTGVVFAEGAKEAITWPSAGNVKPKNLVLPYCMTEDIIATVGNCEASGKRRATFKIKMEGENPVCEDGTKVPGETEVDCEFSHSGSSAGVLAYLLGVVGGGVCGLWAVWILIKFNTKVIKVAQPVFCLSFAIAAALLSLSNVVMVGPNTSGMCALRPWLFNVMFDIMFGSLFLKTFRVYKIFGNKSLSKVKVSVTDVVKTYGGIVAVDLALLLGWTLTGDGMTAVTQEKSLEGFWTYDITVCSDSPQFEFGTTFFKILLVGGGVYLAYITRNVPDKFAEAKWIALSIYQVFVLGLIGLLVQASAPNAMMLVQGICVPVACAATCFCIFGPKWLMDKNPQNYESALATSQATSSNTSDGSAGGGEVEELRSRVQELEVKLAAKGE